MSIYCAVRKYAFQLFYTINLNLQFIENGKFFSGYFPLIRSIYFAAILQYEFHTDFILLGFRISIQFHCTRLDTYLFFSFHKVCVIDIRINVVSIFRPYHISTAFGIFIIFTINVKCKCVVPVTERDIIITPIIGTLGRGKCNVIRLDYLLRFPVGFQHQFLQQIHGSRQFVILIHSSYGYTLDF